MDKWELRKDLSELYFETTTAEEFPYLSVAPVMKDSLPPGHVWRDESLRELVNIDGYYGEIWASLQQMTNFSYSMVKLIFMKIGLFKYFVFF